VFLADTFSIFAKNVTARIQNIVLRFNVAGFGLVWFDLNLKTMGYKRLAQTVPSKSGH